MRMQKHVTLLGALFIAYHILGFIFGIVIMTLLPAIGRLSGEPEAFVILRFIGVGMGTFLIVLSIPGLVAGIGLLARKGWARILALIVGGFDLIDIPLGTALGVYTFWSLLQDDVMEVFEPKVVPPGGTGDA